MNECRQATTNYCTGQVRPPRASTPQGHLPPKRLPLALPDFNLTWWCGVVVSGVRRMNEVNPRRARLLLGRVTVFGGGVYYLGM